MQHDPENPVTSEPAPEPRTTPLRRRPKMLVGSGIVAALVLAASLWQGLFNGFGGGDGDGEEGNVAANVSSPDTPEEKPREETRPDEEPPRVVDVLVHERSYYFGNSVAGETRYEPADLPVVVAAAKAAPGDQSGIKVRIHRTKDSRNTAEQALDDALAKAGISPLAIKKEKGWVDRAMVPQ